jgi:hypothetical protein
VDFIDLSNKQCPQGHTTLRVVDQVYGMFYVACTTCGETYEEGELDSRSSSPEIGDNNEL